MKKILFALCLSMLIVVSCDEKKKHSVGNGANYGTFVFSTDELVVDVDSQTTSFRLEGRYTELPDVDVYGDIWLYLDADKTTAKYPEQFVLAKFVKFTENDNGVLYHDVTIHPETIDKEVVIVYHTKTLGLQDADDAKESLSKDSKIKVVLRPVEQEQPLE